MMFNKKGFFALPEEEPASLEVKIGKAPPPAPRRPISIKLPSVQRAWQLLFAGAILAVIVSAILMSMSSRYYLLNQGSNVFRIDRWTGETDYINAKQGGWVRLRKAVVKTQPTSGRLVWD